MMRIKGKKSYYLYQQNFLEIKSKSKIQNINKSIKNNGKNDDFILRDFLVAPLCICFCLALQESPC